MQTNLTIYVNQLDRNKNKYFDSYNCEKDPKTNFEF